MKVGCVKEIKNNEFRVGMTPDNVKSYVNAGHDVYIEKGAGEGSGFLDAEYEAAGAKMIDTAKEVWDTVEMMMKWKNSWRCCVQKSRFRKNIHYSTKD